MKEKVIVSLDPCKIKELDEIRGIIPRSAYVRRLIENEITAAGDQNRQVSKTHNGMSQNHQNGGAVSV